MKSLITTLLTIGLLAPAGASYAFDIEKMIEEAKAGNGTYVETHSSASTGGQTARSGETVTTGDVSASSHTETTINAGNNGSEVKVKIETSENGNTKTEEYSTPIEKGEDVKVEAKAEAANGEYSTEVKVNEEVVESNANETATADFGAHTAAAPVAFQSKISLLFTTKIPEFFKRVAGFFSWF